MGKLDFSYLVESFDNHNYNPNITISGNAIVDANSLKTNMATPLSGIASDYVTTLRTVERNTGILDDSIAKNNALTARLTNNDKYDFGGNTLVYGAVKKPKSVKDAAQEDINLMILEQNNIYILGSITVATLLILVIYAIK